ncbi:hypothetical protein RZS08_25285, partial [Arthrospira platensis SPKY1]|nr:hypothetical protein [Arthrospira platensis SPKY1]
AQSPPAARRAPHHPAPRRARGHRRRSAAAPAPRRSRRRRSAHVQQRQRFAGSLRVLQQGFGGGDVMPRDGEVGGGEGGRGAAARGVECGAGGVGLREHGAGGGHVDTAGVEGARGALAHHGVGGVGRSELLVDGAGAGKRGGGVEAARGGAGDLLRRHAGAGAERERGGEGDQVAHVMAPGQLSIWNCREPAGKLTVTPAPETLKVLV